MTAADITTPVRPPWMLTAAELGAAYRRHRLSPVDALGSVLARLDAVNPLINAVVTQNVAEAFESAARSERRWREGRPLSLLDGVPFTVKDNIPTAGVRSTFGSRLYQDHVPAQDELPVARLRAAGAVLVGKTNVPEFALHGYTGNAVFGVTRNPWNPALTPGGSSGGAVAAVAAGIAPIAIATDGGGSIRRPCAHAGVAGLKPSLGRVPRAGGFPAFLHDFEVIGPIARTVGDLELVMPLIAGFHASDARSLPFRQKPFCAGLPAKPARILALAGLGDAPVDPETQAALKQAAGRLAGLGHELAVPAGAVIDTLADAIAGINARAWPVISQAGLAWFIATHFPDREAELTPPAAQLFAAGKALRAVDYQDALHRVARLRDCLASLFENVDCLLLPSAAAQAWGAERTHPDTIAGQPVGPRGHAVFTAFVNASGLPAIALPMGLSCTGLPLGVQLVGQYGADEALCALGRQLESAAPWPLLWENAAHAAPAAGLSPRTPHLSGPDLAATGLASPTGPHDAHGLARIPLKELS